MKRYKVYFSIFNVFEETQKEVVKLQSIFKVITVSVAALSYFSSHPDYVNYIALMGIATDTLLSCFWFERIGE